MRFRSLQVKLVIIFGLCAFVTAAALVSYELYANRQKGIFVAESMYQSATEAAGELLLEKARNISANVDTRLEMAMDVARTLADVLAIIKDPSINLRMDRQRINGILRSILMRNPDFTGVYTLWEPDALDGLDNIYAKTLGHDQTGRFIPYWSRAKDGTIRLNPLVGYESEELLENGIREGERYLLPREGKRETAIAPMPYPFQEEIVWMAPQVVPIVADDTFYGITGVDMSLEFVQTLIEAQNADFYDGAGRMAVVSYEGILAAVSDAPDLKGRSLEAWLPEIWQEAMTTIQSDQEVSRITGEFLHVIVPIEIGRSERPWAVIAEIPQTVVLEQAQMLSRELARRGQRDTTWQLAAALIITAITLLIIWGMARQIVLPLRKSVDIAKAVATGDLTVQIDMHQHDEIGILADALRDMLARLRGIVIDVKNSADNVASRSQAMSSSAAQMSEGASTQAAAAEEASSSMQEMAANIRQNTDNALQTEKNAVQAAKNARESGEAVMNAVNAMREIEQRITMINEITTQTRMLSLNATIEAARAQEHGKGFAVVASEVRSLAERSQTAATEIIHLVSTGVSLAEHAGERLKQLVPDIQKTAELVQEISAASREQNTGAEQINRAIQQLDQVTQQNSTTAEEFSATAEDLTNQAKILQQTIEFFQVGETINQTSAQEDAPILPPSSGRRIIQRPAHTKKNETTGVEERESGDEWDNEFERY